MKFTGERMIPGFNQGSSIYLEHMNRYYFASQFVDGKVVLDIACGSGYGSEILQKSGAKKVTGVDISEETINFCKENYKQIDFRIGSVDQIPQEDDSVDVVVSFETIEHIDAVSQEKFMKETRRILKKDGILVLSTPNALVYEKGNKFHVKELTPEELDGLLKRHGFGHTLLFQEAVDANYILSAKEIESGSVDKKSAFIFENTEKRSPWDARYLIAVCSKGSRMPEFSGSVYVSNSKAVRRVAGAETAYDHNDEIRKKDAELEFIKSSKFWKFRELYLKIKSRII